MSQEFLEQCDPILGAMVERIGPLAPRVGRPEHHFPALLRIIVGQQLSTKVAKAIYGRFSAAFGEEPDPCALMELPEENFRAVGLSGAKARSVKDLALHVCDGRLQLAKLNDLPEEEIRAEVTAVKGLGPWSADMFLMFHLEHPDILPAGDLGIREAVRRLYQLEARPEPVQMQEIAQPWRPHRTLACRYLWRSLDNEPAA